MNASELITKLQETIDQYGDLPVEVNVENLPGIGEVFGCFVDNVEVATHPWTTMSAEVVITITAP